MNAVTAVFCVRVAVACASVVVNVGNALTVNVNVLLLLCGTLLESVTVTVYVVWLRTAPLTPLICPFTVLKFNPDGKLGLTA